MANRRALAMLEVWRRRSFATVETVLFVLMLALPMLIALQVLTRYSIRLSFFVVLVLCRAGYMVVNMKTMYVLIKSPAALGGSHALVRHALAQSYGRPTRTNLRRRL